jgi:hypothetical protein
MSQPKKVGLIVGREWSMPPALIKEINDRDQGVVCDFPKVGAPSGAPSLDGVIGYDVIVDRISHEVPMYRAFLKHAVLKGVKVVNNPFMWSADDKFLGATLAESLGVRSPKTVLLPNREYVPGIKHDESLRNLVYPLDWQAVVAHVGLPCILKDAHGGGWKEVYVCRTLEELIHNYNSSGLLTMIAQEFIEWDEFVRCMCIGQENILPIKYDPKARKYHVTDTFLPPALRERIVNDARTINRALGYDMNSMEFAVKDGVPYAIDFMNCAPDMDVYSLTPTYFEWTVKAMADMLIAQAKGAPGGAPTGWRHFLGGRA